jgi:hypothetical protein
VTAYPKPVENVAWWKRLLARVLGDIPYGWAGEEEGFKGRVRIYLVYDKRCGKFFLDYLRGYRGYFLCPYCDIPKLSA